MAAYVNEGTQTPMATDRITDGDGVANSRRQQVRAMAALGDFADGALVTLGAKADAANTDATSAWSIRSMLGGIWTKLSAIATSVAGTQTVAGAANTSFANFTPPNDTAEHVMLALTTEAGVKRRSLYVQNNTDQTMKVYFKGVVSSAAGGEVYLYGMSLATGNAAGLVTSAGLLVVGGTVTTIYGLPANLDLPLQQIKIVTQAVTTAPNGSSTVQYQYLGLT